MIALTSYHDLTDSISVNTHIDPHIEMREYDSNCTSRMDSVDHAGTHHILSEPEPLNSFESIEGLSNTEVDNLMLTAYCWEQSDVPVPWNLYWTDAAAYRGGLELDDPVFGSSWTKYWGVHTWFDCDPEFTL